MSSKSSAQFAPHTKGIEPHRELVGPKDWIARVDWSPDGKSISAAAKRGLFVWDVETARIKFHIPLLAYHVFAGVWSPDGRVIACAADDGYVRLYDSGDGSLIREIELVPRRLRKGPAERNIEKPVDIRGVSWSPDGTSLACSADSGIVIWDISEGAAKRTLPEATNPISVLWSPNGEFIACSTYGPSVFVWDARQLHARFRFDGSEGPALAWSPDSRYLAFGRDRAINIFDIRRLTLPHILEGHLRRVGGLSFSNKGKLLASREGTRGQGRQRTQTFLWSTESWEQVGQIGEMSSWYLYTAVALPRPRHYSQRLDAGTQWSIFGMYHKYYKLVRNHKPFTKTLKSLS